MGGVKRRAAGALLIGSVLGLVGCAPDQSPVPTTAAAPYVCDGVPRASVELILGGPVDALQRRDWDDPAESEFACEVDGRKGRARVSIIVTNAAIQLPPYINAPGSSQLTLEDRAAESGAPAIEADAPGLGFVLGGDRAMWLCGDVVLDVRFIGDPVKGRDAEADLAALVTSMLPWGCGGEEAPAAGAAG